MIDPQNEQPIPVQTDAKTSSADIGKWFQRVAASEKYMRQHFLPKYNLARRRLRSDYGMSVQGKFPTHNSVNLVYSIGNSFVNSVAFKMPEINCTAREDAEVDHVENTEIKINDTFKDKKAKKTAKRIIWDAYLGGFGLSFQDYEYADIESGEPMIDSIGQPMIGPDGQPMMGRIVTKNTVTITRIRPDLFRFPKGFSFDTFQDSPWIGFDTILPKDEVMGMKQFNPEVLKNIKGSYFDDLSDRENPKDTKGNDDVLYVKLHYLFEKPSQEGQLYKMIVLTDDDKDTPLLEQDYDKGTVGYPIKSLYFNPVDDDFPYPSGDPWIWEAQISAIDKFWKRLLNHTKRMNRKYIYDKKNVTPTEVQNAKSNEDMEFIGIENKKNQPLAEIFTPVADNPVTGDNYKFYELGRGLLSELAPRSNQSLGSKDDQTDTATQAEIINAGEMIDIDARVDVIREYFNDVALDVAGLLENSLVGQVQINGKNPDGAQISRTASRGEFTSKLNIDVDTDSMQHVNKDVYRRQMLDLLGQLHMIEPDLNNDPRGPKTIDFSMICEKVFQNIGIRGMEKAIIPLNIRNPNKEHEDMVFHGVPMQVQPKENSKEHLQAHIQHSQDPIAMQLYEKMKPGYTEMLQGHIMQTQQDLENKEKQKVKPGQSPSGKRPMQATELSRSNRV